MPMFGCYSAYDTLSVLAAPIAAAEVAALAVVFTGSSCSLSPIAGATPAPDPTPPVLQQLL